VADRHYRQTGAAERRGGAYGVDEAAWAGSERAVKASVILLSSPMSTANPPVDQGRSRFHRSPTFMAPWTVSAEPAVVVDPDHGGGGFPPRIQVTFRE